MDESIKSDDCQYFIDSTQHSSRYPHYADVSSQPATSTATTSLNAFPINTFPPQPESSSASIMAFQPSDPMCSPVEKMQLSSQDKARLISATHIPWPLPSPHSMRDNYPTPDLECEDLIHHERGIAGFVAKLYQSLEAKAEDGEKYARWCKHNGIDMFIIDCIPKFTEVVLPRLFKHCKFASFVRQLNIYGFQRDTDARKSKDSRDKETCRWYHPYFLPGRRDLFPLIRRKTPGYSRGKRSKMREDPPTIVSMGSGDESEDEPPQQRRRLSSTSSVATKAGSLSQPALSSEQSSSQPADIQEHSSPKQSQRQPSQEVQQNRLHMIQSSPQGQFAQPEPMQCTHSPTVTSSERVKIESEEKSQEELRAEIALLSQNYEKMHRILTAKMSKAFAQIEAQRERIEQLEYALRYNCPDRQARQSEPQYMDASCTYVDAFAEPYVNNMTTTLATAPIKNKFHTCDSASQQQQQQQQQHQQQQEARPQPHQHHPHHHHQKFSVSTYHQQPSVATAMHCQETAPASYNLFFPAQGSAENKAGADLANENDMATGGPTPNARSWSFSAVATNRSAPTTPLENHLVFGMHSMPYTTQSHSHLSNTSDSTIPDSMP